MANKFTPGTILRGNVNGGLMEVVKIEGCNATLKNLKTGYTFTCGIRTLEKCDVTIVEGKDG